MGKCTSKRRPKRSFYGNQHTRVAGKCLFKNKNVGRPAKLKKLTARAEQQRSQTSPIAGPSHSSSKSELLQSTPRESRSASFNKLSFAKKLDEIKRPATQATGYRFIDIDILSGIFKILFCPHCMTQNSLTVEDDLTKKNGCASHLMLACQECDWSHNFYTSKKTKGSYEVNRRLVYGMRSIGSRYSSAKKFCAVMNIPTLPTKNNYSRLNKSL